VIAVLFALGVWVCDITGRHLGIPDHGSMVWDEIVAFLLVLAIVPATLAWQSAAFLLFRPSISPSRRRSAGSRAASRAAGA
jgi:phosphatidylglycerophosphatase A